MKLTDTLTQIRWGRAFVGVLLAEVFMIAGAFAASEPSTSETNETTRRPTYRSTRPS